MLLALGPGLGSLTKSLSLGLADEEKDHLAPQEQRRAVQVHGLGLVAKGGGGGVGQMCGSGLDTSREGEGGWVKRQGPG